MKKFNLFALSIFAVALWSCTDKNDLGGSNVPDRDIAANYISVSIVPAMETGTRVLEEDVQEGENGDYVYGSDAEHHVNNVRFYFFDANGNSQAVKRNVNGTWSSYYDVTKNTLIDPTEEKDIPNVEKIIKATLVLESPKGDLVPASLVAVVNYDSSLFDGDEISSISDLMSKTGNFAKSSFDATDGILMSSAVYKEDNGTQVVELKLKPDDFKRNSDDALENPVTIYVERAVAKVSLSTDKFEGTTVPNASAAGGKIFPLKENSTTGSNVDLEINGEQIYIKFLGWNVTQTADKSYAVKNLAAAWKGSTPFSGWSFPAYHRSYWALNPEGVTMQYTNFEGTSADLPEGVAIKGISDNDKAVANYTYATENAPQTEDKMTRTEVLVAAQLVDEDGKAIKLAEFNGFRFMGDNYQTQVLQAAANMINVWKKTLVSGSDTDGDAVYKYESIQDCLKLVSARAVGKYDESDSEKNTGSYFTYVQLKTNEDKAGIETTTFVDNDDANGTVVSYEALNAMLLNLPYIKVWTEGKTYYYTYIEHLNDSAETNQYPVGKYGVVRNHWYAIDVTKVYGLGTPVFDPSEKIIPEDPSGHESYLAAKINILSWRLVSQSTTLGQ